MTLKLLSGMFRSTLCTVSVTGKGICILPNSSGEKESLLAFSTIKDIFVSQNGTMQARLEITTDDGIVSGVFEKQSDVNDFLEQIRVKAGKALQTELRFQ